MLRNPQTARHAVIIAEVMDAPRRCVSSHGHGPRKERSAAAGRLEVRGRTSQLRICCARRLPELGFKTQILCPDASRLGKEVTQGLRLTRPRLWNATGPLAAWYWESWELAETRPI